MKDKRQILNATLAGVIAVNSRLVDQFGLELLGGRYCSLQGITAAQLRVKKPGSNTVQTLYQAEYRKNFSKTCNTGRR